MKINRAMLKGLIFAKGLKQWQICRKINLSETYFSKIIQGKINPSQKLVEKIAAVLKIDPNKLLQKEVK